MTSYLNNGLPIPVPHADNLDAAFWAGLRDERLMLQRCTECLCWQWGPEWCCHQCRSFSVEYSQTPADGVIYSHQRVWHPVHHGLADQGPYIIVLVELPAADNCRIIGNLIGDPMQDLTIGSPVSGVFEHHQSSEPSFTLLNWELR